MNGNSESTSNSIKFAPMPMSELLANLMPLRKASDTPESDSSITTDEGDESSNEIAMSKTPPKNNTNKYSTPQYQVTKNRQNFASDKKLTSNEHNKENFNEFKLQNQIHSKDNILPSAQKLVKDPSAHTNTDMKKRSVLIQQDTNVKVPQVKINLAHKNTPEIKVPSSSQKTKTGTPVIKSGIRKFTPGSSRHSQKKTPQATVVQNRDKVRCELFRHNQRQLPAEPPKPAPVMSAVPVPETPVNRKPMPASYAATPSYPQGIVGDKSKISFKTTSIKDKKYMFIKKLGKGGSSEVFKVCLYIITVSIHFQSVNISGAY